MPDLETPAAQPEAPAPSTTEAPSLDYSAYELAANEAQRKGEPLDWPPAAESAPATETPSEAPTEEAVAETAPAPEPEKTEEPAKPEGKGVKARNAKLDQEIQELQAKLARRHELRQELERGEARPAPPAAETPAKVPEGKPVFETFLVDAKTYEEAIEKYTDARDAWNRQQWRAEQEAENNRRTAQEAAIRLQEKLLASEAAHEDWDTVMNSPAVKSIRLTPEAQGALNAYLARKSEHPGELLYHLGKNPDQFRKIANGDALTVISELARIEAGLNGKAGPVAAPAPVKKHSSAPAPITELAARNAGVGDEVTEAVRSGDYKAYERAANARELASRKRA